MSTRVAGSYFRNDFMGSLGADDRALPFPDQALIGIVQAQPTLTYTEWARQTSDNAWTEVTPSSNYQAFAVNDFQLVAVANTTSAEVQTLAVISPRLTLPASVKVAFEGTPFAYVRTEAVYAQIDTASPPQIYFLYWLTLREQTDPKIGPTSLNFAATSIAGVLSYILEVPPGGSDRARPGMSFAQAFTTQAARSPLTIPQTQAVQATAPLPSASPGLPTPMSTSASFPASAPTQQASLAPASSASTMKALLLVGLGTAAAVGAYRLYQNRKGA